MRRLLLKWADPKLGKIAIAIAVLAALALGCKNQNGSLHASRKVPRLIRVSGYLEGDYPGYITVSFDPPAITGLYLWLSKTDGRWGLLNASVTHEEADRLRNSILASALCGPNAGRPWSTSPWSRRVEAWLVIECEGVEVVYPSLSEVDIACLPDWAKPISRDAGNIHSDLVDLLCRKEDRSGSIEEIGRDDPRLTQFFAHLRRVAQDGTSILP